MTNRKMTNEYCIDLGNNLKLKFKTIDPPYDKEIAVYLEKNNKTQEIARISPEYDIIANNVIYNNERISVKLYTDPDNEDFTQEHLIPVDPYLLYIGGEK